MKLQLECQQGLQLSESLTGIGESTSKQAHSCGFGWVEGTVSSLSIGVLMKMVLPTVCNPEERKTTINLMN